MNAEALIGAVLGTCTLQELVGQGAMGAVFLAQQSRPRRQVAVKVLLPMLPLTPHQRAAFLERFRRETDVVASLEHPNIMPVHEYGERDGLAYLVMPYISGGTLRDEMEREGALPLEKAVFYLEQMVAALDFAHERGVIHRDIKPANILLRREGHLLLTDFGLVKIIVEGQKAQSRLTGFGTPMGTPDYMAPEQVIGGEIDTRADLYSLGVILYHMVTGTVPFHGEMPMQIAMQHLHNPPPSPRQLRPDLPVAAEQVLLRALAKNPADRYLRVQDFASAFRLALTVSGIQLIEMGSSFAPSGMTDTRLFTPRGLFDPMWRSRARPMGAVPNSPAGPAAESAALQAPQAVPRNDIVVKTSMTIPSLTGFIAQATTPMMAAQKAPAAPSQNTPLPPTSLNVAPRKGLLRGAGGTGLRAFGAMLPNSVAQEAAPVEPSLASSTLDVSTESLRANPPSIFPAAMAPEVEELLSSSASTALEPTPGAVAEAPAAFAPPESNANTAQPNKNPASLWGSPPSALPPAQKSMAGLLSGNPSSMLPPTPGPTGGQANPPSLWSQPFADATQPASEQGSPTTTQQLAFPSRGITRVLNDPLVSSAGNTTSLLVPGSESVSGNTSMMKLAQPAKVIKVPVAGQPGRYMTGLLPVLEPEEPHLPPSIAKKVEAADRVLKGKLKTVVLVTAVLLVIFASVTFMMVRTSQKNSRQSSLLSSTPDAVATATMIANATVEANTILADPLNENAHNWPVATKGSKLYFFSNKAYHIANNDSHAAIALLPDENLTGNFAYTITAQQVKGDQGNVNNKFGLIIRFSTHQKSGRTATTFYCFEVSNTKSGSYQFWRYDDSFGQMVDPWTMLWSHGFGKEYHPGLGASHTNTLRVVVQKNKFTFMVNGKQVGAAQDSALTSGQVGMLVNLPGAEVAFSDLMLTYK